MAKEDFVAASLIITEACNLACTYCFENCKTRCQKRMSNEVITKALEMLFNNAKAKKEPMDNQIDELERKLNKTNEDWQQLNHLKNNIPKVDIILFGGEPTIYIDACEFAMSEGKRLSEEYKIYFSANIITNCTLWNDDIEKWLIKWRDDKTVGFSVQLSIDGIKEVQDEYRIYRDGRGSFEQAMKNITKYREIIGQYCCVHGCINKKSMPHLFSSYMLFENIYPEASKWWMPVHSEDWDEDDIKLYDEQLNKIFQYNLMTKKFNFAPIDKLPERHMYDCHPGYTCGAGISFLSVTSEGDLYPCHNIYFTDETKGEFLGNVFDGITHEDVLEKYIKSGPTALGCSDCPNTKCYRCVADNFSYNKDINKQIGKPVRCKLSFVERKYQKQCRDARTILDIVRQYDYSISIMKGLLADYDVQSNPKVRNDNIEGWFSRSNDSLNFISTLINQNITILSTFMKPFHDAEAKFRSAYQQEAEQELIESNKILKKLYPEWNIVIPEKVDPAASKSNNIFGFEEKSACSCRPSSETENGKIKQMEEDIGLLTNAVKELVDKLSDKAEQTDNTDK